MARGEEEDSPLLPVLGPDASARSGKTLTARWVLLTLAALLSFSACSATAVIKYSKAFARVSVADVYARTERIFNEHAQYCGTCALVIPSDTYRGKGLGVSIDSADCVVRFNSHGPFNCSSDASSGDGRKSTRCPKTEDYGRKDTIRVMNGNPEMMDLLDEDPCFTKIQGRDDTPTCRRQIVTWMYPDDLRSVSFFAKHDGAEDMEALYHSLRLADPHEAIREFASNKSVPRPGYASSAFVTISALKDPKMCGELYVFGLESTDANESANHGYADDPDKFISISHDYVLEHDFYKTAVHEKFPGWENVKVVKMDAPY